MEFSEGTGNEIQDILKQIFEVRENTSSAAMGFMQHFLKKVRTIMDVIHKCKFCTSTEVT